MPRSALFILIVIVILFAAFDRGARVPVVYPGGVLGLLIVILLLGWLLQWF